MKGELIHLSHFIAKLKTFTILVYSLIIIDLCRTIYGEMDQHITYGIWYVLSLSAEIAHSIQVYWHVQAVRVNSDQAIRKSTPTKTSHYMSNATSINT